MVISKLQSNYKSIQDKTIKITLIILLSLINYVVTRSDKIVQMVNKQSVNNKHVMYILKIVQDVWIAFMKGQKFQFFLFGVKF